MVTEEALGTSQPRKKTKKNKTLRKTIKSYFIVIWSLFAVVLLLCVNNFVVYKSYKNIQMQLDDSLFKLKSVTVNNNNLTEDKESVKRENIKLKDNFDAIFAKNQELLKQVEEVKKQHEELKRANRVLMDDNIALQNSLKIAASVGIKPQSFTKFNGITSRGVLERGKYIGKFLGTAYTPSPEECGNNKGITNSGKPIIPGISVAIDNKYWPYGTVFYIKGLGYAVAMDTGSLIKGKYRFDFAVFDKKFAQTLGAKNWEVYLVRLGKGYVGDVKF